MPVDYPALHACHGKRCGSGRPAGAPNQPGLRGADDSGRGKVREKLARLPSVLAGQPRRLLAHPEQLNTSSRGLLL
jgi:hypothetical protein